MSPLIDPDSYDDIIYRYGLTALYNGVDLQIENGDLALTKDGDLRLGAIPYNAMFRLVQAWRYNASVMRLMFDTIYELRNAKPGLEERLEEILSRGPKKGHFLPSTDVPLYHAANDAIGATEVSRSALAGSLMIVVGSLLGRFKDDLNVSSANWNAGTPSYAAHSFGQVVMAAANSFRHADEWKKALNGETMEMPSDIYLKSDPPRMYKVMRQTKKPCFAFKILAAGRIPDGGIEQAFRRSFESIKPIDGIYVGMFPRVKDEVRENVEIVHRILAGS